MLYEYLGTVIVDVIIRCQQIWCGYLLIYFHCNSLQYDDRTLNDYCGEARGIGVSYKGGYGVSSEYGAFGRRATATCIVDSHSRMDHPYKSLIYLFIYQLTDTYAVQT